MWNISAADWQTPPTPQARKSMVSASHNTRTPTLHAHTHDTHTLTHVCTHVCTHTRMTPTPIYAHHTRAHTRHSDTRGHTQCTPHCIYIHDTHTLTGTHTHTHANMHTPALHAHTLHDTHMCTHMHGHTAPKAQWAEPPPFTVGSGCSS